MGDRKAVGNIDTFIIRVKCIQSGKTQVYRK